VGFGFKAQIFHSSYLTYSTVYREKRRENAVSEVSVICLIRGPDKAGLEDSRERKIEILARERESELDLDR
jgi:hypothetical protein